MLTSHTPSFEGEGQQLTKRTISKIRREQRRAHSTTAHYSHTSQHTSTSTPPSSVRRGTPFRGFCVATTFGPLPGMNIATLGCCLNCNAVPNASAGGCDSVILRCADAGSETWRFTSPFSSKDWRPPSRRRESEISSLMTMCTLRIDEPN